MAELDSFDFRILAILQEDASLSLADLGEHVCLSSNACWRRIRNLESRGVITRRVALLSAEKLGVGSTVFVSIRAPEHSEEWLQSFATAVEGIPEIVELYRMSGDIDYLMKIMVPDIAAYDRVYQRLIRSVRLTSVSSSFAMEEMKHTTAVPLPRC